MRIDLDSEDSYAAASGVFGIIARDTEGVSQWLVDGVKTGGGGVEGQASARDDGYEVIDIVKEFGDE